MCFSKELIYYSSEMKQYSLDVMVALLILLATVRCFEESRCSTTAPTTRRLGHCLCCTDLVFTPGCVRNRRHRPHSHLLQIEIAHGWQASFAALIAALSSHRLFAVLRPLRQSVSSPRILGNRGDFSHDPLLSARLHGCGKAFFLAFRTPGGFNVPSSPQSFS